MSESTITNNSVPSNPVQHTILTPNTGANPVINIPQQYYTADQLEAARQQEKDKLYARLTKQDDMLTAFQQQIDALNTDKKSRDDALAKAQKDAEDAKKAEEESKLSAQELVRQREAELKIQQQEFQTQMDLKIATMQKEQEFLRLQAYIQRRVNEEISKNTIIPDLVEFISGNTEDEVEASINKVIEKTANIVTGAAKLTAPQIPSGVSPTGGPAGPFEALSGQQEPTAQEIAAMSMAQFKEYREKRGIDRAGNGRGLFS